MERKFLDNLYLSQFSREVQKGGGINFSAYYELLISCIALTIGLINLIALSMVWLEIASKAELNKILTRPIFLVLVATGSLVLMRLLFGNREHRRRLEASLQQNQSPPISKLSLIGIKIFSIVFGFGLLFLYLVLI